jgi:hypothetical protein
VGQSPLEQSAAAALKTGRAASFGKIETTPPAAPITPFGKRSPKLWEPTQGKDTHLLIYTIFLFLLCAWGAGVADGNHHASLHLLLLGAMFMLFVDTLGRRRVAE